MKFDLKEDLLLKECLQVLGNDVEILSSSESSKIFTRLEQLVPFTPWGKVDWNKVAKKTVLYDHEMLASELEKTLQKEAIGSAYILWNDASRPVLKTEALNIIENLNEVLYLETWIYDPIEKYVIEILTNGTITLGLI